MEKVRFITKESGYESPKVEILEINVERGFAQSQQEPSPWDDLDAYGY